MDGGRAADGQPVAQPVEISADRGRAFPLVTRPAHKTEWQRCAGWRSSRSSWRVSSSRSGPSRRWEASRNRARRSSPSGPGCSRLRACIFGEALVAASVPPADGWLQLALFALLLVGAAIAAAWGLLIVRRSAEPPYALAFALGTTALFALTLALLPSLPSDDLFSYILYGRISAVHHANPLVVLPSDFPHDPFLQMVYWRDVRSVYGPVWLALSGGLSLVAEALGGSLALYTAIFKLLGVAAHLLNAWLVWLILGRLAPKARLLGTLFYAWSPLCLLEFGASAHNDALMLTFLLLGVYCLTRGTNGTTGWDAAAMVAFGFSIATKYVPLALHSALLRAGDLDRARTWRIVARTLGAVAWRGALLARDDPAGARAVLGGAADDQRAALLAARATTG